MTEIAAHGREARGFDMAQPVRERPIIFSGPMVRAILGGHKTVTRRVVKPQPSAGVRASVFVPSGLEDGHGRELRCPYGVHRLWVRESFAYVSCSPDQPGAFVGRNHDIYSEDDSTHFHVVYTAGLDRIYWEPARLRSPIHMPRWASRFTLRVTGVRAERLHDITEADALLEGVDAIGCDEVPRQATWSRRQDFAQLWDKINAARGHGWSTNPWVWRVEFEVVK